MSKNKKLKKTKQQKYTSAIKEKDWRIEKELNRSCKLLMSWFRTIPVAPNSVQFALGSGWMWIT